MTREEGKREESLNNHNQAGDKKKGGKEGDDPVVLTLNGPMRTARLPAHWLAVPQTESRPSVVIFRRMERLDRGSI